MGRFSTGRPAMSPDPPGSGGPPSGSDAGVDRLLRAMPSTDHVDDGVLVAFRAGALTEDAAAAVAAHLDRCGACRALAEALGEPLSAALLERAERSLAQPRSWFGGARAGVAAGLLAAAAAIVLVFALPEGASERPPEYALAGPFGAVQETRGETVAQGTPVFLSTSRIRLGLAPAEDLVGAPPAVAVFVSEPGGALRAAPPASLTAGIGGAWRFETEAGPLFGDETGLRHLHVVVAADAADLLALEGRRAADVRDEPALRWSTIVVDYRVEAGGGTDR